MTTEVGKVSTSGEQVLALKKYIAKCNQDQERLRDTIQANKEKDEFLMQHRCVCCHACVYAACRRRL